MVSVIYIHGGLPSPQTLTNSSPCRVFPQVPVSNCQCWPGEQLGGSLLSSHIYRSHFETRSLLVLWLSSELKKTPSQCSSVKCGSFNIFFIGKTCSYAHDVHAPGKSRCDVVKLLCGNSSGGSFTFFFMHSTVLKLKTDRVRNVLA